jgi:hypothetical protein
MLIIDTLERISTNYLKLIVRTSGIYEAKIQLWSDIWSFFVFFRQMEVGNLAKLISEKDA